MLEFALLGFFAGILGTLMVGTGSILWVEKRAKKQMGLKGFELVRGTNIGAIAGLMVATGAYFWSNRLIPADMAMRSDWEVRVSLCHCRFIAQGSDGLAMANGRSSGTVLIAAGSRCGYVTCGCTRRIENGV